MKLNKDFILRKVAGQDVLVATGQSAMKYNGLLTISESGSFIWKNLEKATSSEEMLKLLMEEFEVDEETGRKDIKGFTKALVENGLSTYDNPDIEW